MDKIVIIFRFFVFDIREGMSSGNVAPKTSLLGVVTKTSCYMTGFSIGYLVVNLIASKLVQLISHYSRPIDLKSKFKVYAYRK